MKQYWLWVSKIVTFSAVIWLVLSFLPYDDGVKYRSLKTGVYQKSAWLYNRAAISQEPVDIAFIGTSHTLLAINDQLIEEDLNKQLNTPVRVANFSIPQYGRDLHFHLLNLLLSNKSPKIVYIEVRESEARDLHPGMSYLAKESELLSAPPIVNLRFFENLLSLPARNFSLFSKTYFSGLFPTDGYTEAALKPHFFSEYNAREGTKREVRVTPDELVRAKKKLTQRASYMYEKLPEWKTYLFFNASHTYVQRMIALTKAHNVQLKFLYLPNFQTKSLPVRDFYSQYGELVSPNMSVFSRTDIWNDVEHLNVEGSDLYRQLVVDDILQTLEENR